MIDQLEELLDQLLLFIVWNLDIVDARPVSPHVIFKVQQRDEASAAVPAVSGRCMKQAYGEVGCGLTLLEKGLCGLSDCRTGGLGGPQGLLQGHLASLARGGSHRSNAAV